MARLSGKVALITGATGGIGEASAKLFFAEGASVMLVGRSKEKLRETIARLGASKAVATFVAEAADEAGISAAVAATVGAFGSLDIVFANAGMEGTVGMIADSQLADFERVVRTNVSSVWLAIKHSVTPMRQRGGGSIIVTASISGERGFAGGAPYVTSKHAVIGLVRSAALELAAAGIRVNAIAPGPIDNRMIRSIETQISPESPDKIREFLLSKIAMGRYGTNEEVAEMALFLASDAASYSTGGTFMVDGGFTAA